MKETLNEDLLEQLYWEFDFERAKKYSSERDIFKHKMRHFAKYHLPKKPITCNFCGLKRTEKHCRCINNKL